MNEADLSRAKFAVSALVLSTGVLAVAGVLSLFGSVAPVAAPLLKSVCILAFAAMAAAALFVAQAAAACAQILDDDAHRYARAVAYGCAVLTGLVSVGGVYLGDGILRGAPEPDLPPVQVMLAVGFLLAFIKPAMSYVITACEAKEARRADGVDALLAAKDRRIGELESELRRLRRSPPAEPGSPPRKGFSVVGKAAAAGAAAVILAGAGSQAHAEAERARSEPAPRSQSAGSVTPADRAEAKALIAQGLAPKAVSERTGVPHGTCKRYASELRAA